MQTRQYSFHQEQEHPDGLPKLMMMSVQDIKDLIKDVLHLVATEVLGRWEKKRKKEYRGARPWSRLGPAGPL
jgi:hypothetical protein